jgi:hypothetical protein
MVNSDFVILFGTILFFALLHAFPPDGRRWQREELEQPVEPLDAQPEHQD